MLIQHVAQHLSGHHHDIRFGIDGDVTGEQSDLILAVRVDQVMVLLVA